MEIKNINKFIYPIAIIVSVMIIGGSFMWVQYNKQESIEKQQRLELEAERKESEAKAEQEEKEYMAKRKTDCLDIYKTESDKWNNVQGWRYNEYDDECFIKYKDPNPKSEAKCDEDYPVGDDWGLTWLRRNSLCKDRKFEKVF